MEEYQIIAEKAADVISRYGHTKYMLCDENGSVCFRGAIQHAVNYNVDIEPNWNRLQFGDAYLNALEEIEPKAKKILELNGDVVHWNNEEERSAEDVILLFKRIAAGEGKNGE